MKRVFDDGRGARNDINSGDGWEGGVFGLFEPVNQCNSVGKYTQIRKLSLSLQLQ